MECRSYDLVKENVIENVGLKKPLLFEIIKELNISYEKVLNILRELRKNLDNLMFLSFFIEFLEYFYVFFHARIRLLYFKPCFQYFLSYFFRS